MATVYLLRSERRGDKHQSIYCGTIEIAKLGARHYVEVQIPPGEYLFQSPGIEHTVRMRAEPEQTYYIHFFPNAFLTTGTLELEDPLQADDLLAFPWWRADSKIDLSQADPARLRDTTPLPKPKVEAESSLN